MANDFFPKGRLAIGSGDLNMVTDVTLDRNNNMKNHSTMRRPNAGQVAGSQDDSLEFTSSVGAEGFERDFDEPYRRKELVSARFKVPGKTYPFEGRYGNLNITSNVDGVITFKAKLVGFCGEPT